MFDLNEPPEDDIEMLPANDVECTQPAQEPKAYCMQQKEPDPNFVKPSCEVGNAGMSIGCAAFPVQQVDLAPLPLGQHPLSCFRPFVKTISKGLLSDGAMLVENGSSSSLKNILDRQSLAASWNMGAQNGELVSSGNASSNRTSEAALVAPGRCGNYGETNGHRPEDCYRPKDGLGNVQEMVGSSKDSRGPQETNLTSTVVHVAKEVQDNTLLRSTPVDACIKTDVARGVEDTPASNLVKRNRLDQKDAMLGKKRARQTMFLDVREAAKQAPPPKASTVKKSSSLSSIRNHKEVPKTPVAPFIDARPKDSKSFSPSSDGFRGPLSAISPDLKSIGLTSSEGILNDGQTQSQGLVKKVLPSSADEIVDGFSLASATVPSKYTSWKGDGDEKGKVPELFKPVVGKHTGGSRGKLVGEEKPTSYVRPLAKKNFNNYRKHTVYSQDSSIERLHREATCEKLWNSPAATSMLSPVERRLCVCILLQSRVASTWSRQCLMIGILAAYGA